MYPGATANATQQGRGSDPNSRGKFGAKIAPAVNDKGLRKLLTWVFTALVVTVLFAILVVELTLRWFR